MPAVLVIDDDPSIARMLRQALSTTRIEVAAAFGVDHAVKLLLSGTYAAIVLDLVLGDRSGFDVLDAMRAANLMMPVIVISARLPDYARMLLQPSQVLTIVRKPFDIELLRSVILALCGVEEEQQPLVLLPPLADEANE